MIDKKPKMIDKRNKIKIVISQDIYKKENTVVLKHYFSTPNELDDFCEKMEKEQKIENQFKQNGNEELNLFRIQLDDEASKKYAQVIKQIDILDDLTKHLYVYSYNKQFYDLHKLNGYEISILNKKYSFSRAYGNFINLSSLRKETYSLRDKQNTEISIYNISLYHIDKIILNLDQTIKIYEKIIKQIPHDITNKFQDRNSKILALVNQYLNK